MIEISIFTKPESTREHLLFSFDNEDELVILKKFLRNGAENVDFKTALELDQEVEK